MAQNRTFLFGVDTGERLVEFKAAVTGVLTRETSAVLLDPEYGGVAAGQRAKGCGLLLAYEMDGYENPRPHRMLALPPQLSVRRLCALGAQGVKILLHYAPDEGGAANDEKRALIERIGSECSDLDVPFFLEPWCMRRTVSIRGAWSSRAKSLAG